MAALARRDVALLRDGIERVADVGGAVSPRAARKGDRRGSWPRACARRGTTAARLLQELVPLLAELGIRLPGDLVLLSRALVTLDGTLPS